MYSHEANQNLGPIQNSKKTSQYKDIKNNIQENDKSTMTKKKPKKNFELWQLLETSKLRRKKMVRKWVIMNKSQNVPGQSKIRRIR